MVSNKEEKRKIREREKERERERKREREKTLKDTIKHRNKAQRG